LVNVGLFAQPGNAKRVYDKLQEAKLPATSQAFQTSKGLRTRIRVGPFKTAQAAQAAADTVQKLGLEAQVFVP